MAKFHTHYDNLKVARDAPPEVIKAAYRALAQRYHPDVNPSSDAARVMKLINEAWQVLSDPAARRRHDEWIEDQLIAEVLAEAAAEMDTPRERNATKSPPSSAGSTNGNQADNLDRFTSWLAHATRSTYALLGAAAFVLLVVWAFSKQTPLSSISQPEQLVIPGPAYSEPSKPAYREPAATPSAGQPKFNPFEPTSRTTVGDSTVATVRWSPNGQPWPVTAGYLKGNGIRQRAFGGLSKLTIDNTNGGSSVYVKLCRPNNERCDGLRHVFITQGASFVLANIAPGTYDIRYRDLSSGHIARSEPLLLQQIEDAQGTRFSVVRLTLYRVAGGNTSFVPLSEEQF